jgi:thiamine-phosphate pyrophosphorylase
MPPEGARKVVGKDMLIGVSTHNTEEVKAAVAGGADFITFGPIFETPSKVKYGAQVGIEALTNAISATRKPIFALGGVKSGVIGQIMASGAYGISVISAILGADDIRKAAEVLVQETAGAGRGRS